VKGSVNVRIKRKVGFTVEDKVVVVLYDGFAFGELAMMKTTEQKSLED